MTGKSKSPVKSSGKKKVTKSAEKKKGIDSSKIALDDAGRFELDSKQLDKVSGGRASSPRAATARGEVCRIQTSPKGCSMNM